MEAKCVLLKLFLDELGISESIATVDDRKRVQKAVYLGQRAGADLGYRFGWYLMGPYSKGLAEDYYALAESLEDGKRDHEQWELIPSLNEHLPKAKCLMEVPENVPLEQEDWLELVASVDYLQKVSNLSSQKALAVLWREKPQLTPHYAAATESLQQVGLLQK